MNNKGQNAQPLQGAGAAAAANNQLVHQLEIIFSNLKATEPWWLRGLIDAKYRVLSLRSEGGFEPRRKHACMLTKVAVSLSACDGVTVTVTVTVSLSA
jgi:hypothetical protein